MVGLADVVAQVTVGAKVSTVVVTSAELEAGPTLPARSVTAPAMTCMFRVMPFGHPVRVIV